VSATATQELEHVPFEGLGRPIQGPRALTDDWARFWHLTFNIARTQWKMRFFGSALGYLWQLMRPLLLFTVLYVFFTKVARVGQGPLAAPGQPEHFYGAQLLGSIVLFNFFAEATAGSIRSVLESEVLVRKIHFPRLVIPLSVVLLALFNLSLNLLVVFVFALISGVRPMLTWLELPLIILLIAFLATGLAMLLSAMFVYFRDVEPIWEVLLQVLFYISPVIIPIDAVAAHVSTLALKIYMVNPVATVLQQFRHAIINHATPSAGQVLGSQAALLLPVGIAVVFFIGGFVVFNRAAPYVAENL
jgi:ABC-2 type transport system permease protein